MNHHQPLVSASNLSVDTRVKSVSFSLDKGEVLGLIGPNGAGKSTLLNSLAGLEQGSGEVRIDGQAFDSLPAKRRARLLGLQPQSLNSVWSLSVADVVALGRMPWGDSDAKAIQNAMQRAGVSELAQRSIDHLSGGERARVWLARVFAGEPLALLSDEPIASLDIHYQLEVMEVLKAYANEGNGVMVAMHDLSLAARFCDRLCLMQAGEMVAKGSPAEVLTESLLSRVYGVEVEVNLEHNPPIVLPK